MTERGEGWGQHSREPPTGGTVAGSDPEKREPVPHAHQLCPPALELGPSQDASGHGSASLGCPLSEEHRSSGVTLPWCVCPLGFTLRS